jgi:exodeoxyribonuclease VII large subunit
VPDYAEVTGGLTRAQQAMRRRGTEHVRGRAERITMLRSRLADRSPARFVEERRRWIGAVRDRGRSMVEQRIQVARTSIDRDRRDLDRTFHVRLDERRARVTAAMGRLRALSPTAVVDRGYAIVRGAGGRVVQGAGDIAVGEQVQVAVARGTLRATVDEVEVDA